MRRVFLRDMILEGRIGVLPHEHGRSQRVRINIELQIEEAGPPARDELAAVVDYASLARRVRETVAVGHVKLVETLAERVAAAALFDPRVCLARVRVEKLDVFADVASVGVEIERTAADLSTHGN